MLLKSTIREVFYAQKEYLENAETGQERDSLHNIRLDTNFVSIVTGIRRSGKSTFLKQLIKQKIKDACFINFEDPRLAAFTFDDFTKLQDIFDEQGENPYYVFDEIQNIPKWELFIRAQQDQGRKIIVTGSNASLLSKELGTRLTGRHLDYEMFPFSFNEFVTFNKYQFDSKSLENHLNRGGFPEYLKTGEPEILYRLSEDILYRDVAVRYGIKNHRLLKQILVYLITNSSKLFSYNKLKVLFGLGSINTIRDYIAYFEDSYLLFMVPKFSYSLKKQIYNPQKIYTIDTGLANAMSISFSEDKGRKLENMVFIYLRKNHKNIYYFSEKNECDFILFEKGKVTNAIQVCYELNADNINRETNGLWEAMEATNLQEGTIITFDQEDYFIKSEMMINVIPAWKYFANTSGRKM